MLTRRQLLGLSGLAATGVLGTGAPASAATDALATLRGRLASGGLVRLATVGSSTTAGVGASTKSARYVDRLARALQSGYGRAGGGIYLNVDSGWTYTGTTAAGSSGLALKNRRLEPGAAMKRSSSISSCTAVTLTYAEGPGCGSFTVSFGGVTQTVTPSTSGTSLRYTGVHRTPSQPVGSKSLSITAGSSAVVLDGFYAHNGDEGAGVQVWQGGKSGTASGNYGGTTSMPPRLGSLAVDGVILMVGSNDFARGVSIPTYTANVSKAVAKFRAARPGVVTVLVHSYQRMGVSAPAVPWASYGAALKSIADASPSDVAFHDVSGAFAARGVPGPDPENLIGSDNTHCTDLGYQLLAELVHAPLAR